MIRALKIAYNVHIKRRSLSRQGLIPWWVERTGSTSVRHHPVLKKKREARHGQ